MRVRMKLSRPLWIAAVALSIGVPGAPIWGAASASPQEQHDQDYSRNKNYKVGMRDGRDDVAHNRDHSRKRKFKKDEDQRAYEAGYQAAHQDNSRDHR
jgi:hypothetical protein